MAVHCDICGVQALEREEFELEQLPFPRGRRYCPARHRKDYFRIYTPFALLPVGFGILAALQAWAGNKSLLQTKGVWWTWLILLQWLMVVPHELGHALMARALGDKQIRIIVGFGRPVFSVNFLGFPWLLNLIPFGGAMLP